VSGKKEPPYLAREYRNIGFSRVPFLRETNRSKQKWNAERAEKKGKKEHPVEKDTFTLWEDM